MRFQMDIELSIARHLVRELLDHGFRISVHDGEAWALKRSTSAKDIIEALRSTDSDTLVARDAEGISKGVVQLIWGNDIDVVADYSVRLEPFIANTNALIDKLAESY